MSQPDSDVSLQRSRRQKAPRGPLLLLLLLLGAGAFGAYYFFWSRPQLIVTNRLAAPLRLAVDSGEAALISPGQSRAVSLPRKKTLVAMWELVRPLSADGRPMGEEVKGSLVQPDPRGTIQQVVTPRGTQGDYFAPLISNATNDLIRIKVNAGIEGGLDCGCAVRPGAKRAFIGYYRLYRNSTVQARTADGRTATFPDLGPSVVAGDGTLGLRFEAKDLRRR